jgi:hypothetical protein
VSCAHAALARKPMAPISRTRDAMIEWIVFMRLSSLAVDERPA